MRILIALASFCLMVSGMVTLSAYTADPAMTSAYLWEATGHKILLSIFIIWAPIPLGLCGLVIASSSGRPRRR
jgi:hypothetical protein